MSVDTAEMAAVAPVDTASTPDAALSEPTAPGDAVESPGDAAVIEGSPEPDDSTSEASEQSDDEAADDQPRTEAEQKLSRSQRRALREQERIDQAVQAAIATRETEASTKAAEAARVAEAQKVAQARTEKLQKFLGAPDASDKPGTLRSLDAEIASLHQQINSELLNPQGIDIDTLAATVAEKQATRSRLHENNEMAGQIEEVIWDTFAAEFQSLAMRPEIANDPAKQARYLNAPGGVKGAVNTLCDMVAASVETRKDAEIAEVRTKAAAELKAMTADRDIHRFNAGAGPAPESAGRATNGSARSVIERLKTEAGSPEEFARRAARGDYARVDLTG